MRQGVGASVNMPSRRRVLHGLAAAGASMALPACTSRLSPGACPVDGRGNIIDVHCHVFNASDVPVDGFVRYVVLGEHREEVLPQAMLASRGGFTNSLIRFLVRILTADTVTAAEEARNLRRRLPMESATALKQRQTEAVADALLELDQSQREGATIMSAGSGDDALLEQIYAEAGTMRMMSQDKPLDRQQADEVARSLSGKESPIARYVDFARLLLGSREAITREYIRLFSDNRCVQLVTPSFLDMHRWLGKAPRSSIESQIDVMDELQAAIAGSTGVRMHSMVGFDPRRAAEDRNVLKLVKHAVYDCGFIGVKLYPPMGFRASGNDRLKVPKDPPGPGGAEIERALISLYDWCAREHVPIMAHAENSLGSIDGYGCRASPYWWRRLLAKPRYGELRINLAHFGSFDEVLGGEVAGGKRICGGNNPDDALWEDMIGEAIRDDRREHLFADLGYLGELALAGDGADEARKREGVRTHLKRFRESYDPEVHHLMYGTDWTMIAKEVGNNRYLSTLDAQLRLAGFDRDQLQNIYWRNAVRFLGLRSGDKTHDRLRAYCKRRQIDGEWLNSFG